MINRSRKHSAFLAIFFFTAFVGVITTNTLCDLEIIQYAPNLAHSHSAEASDSHHKDAHHNHHSSDPSDGNSHEDPCCEDVSSQLEDSLFSKLIKNKTVEVKYFLLGQVVLSSKNISFYQPIHSLYHEYDDPPPLSGYSIRVLIQSFLN